MEKACVLRMMQVRVRNVVCVVVTESTLNIQQTQSRTRAYAESIILFDQIDKKNVAFCLLTHGILFSFYPFSIIAARKYNSMAAVCWHTHTFMSVISDKITFVCTEWYQVMATLWLMLFLFYQTNAIELLCHKVHFI